MAVDKDTWLKGEGIETKPDAVTVTPPETTDNDQVMVSVDEPAKKDAKPDAKAVQPGRDAPNEEVVSGENEDLGPDPTPDQKRERGRPPRGYVKQEALWEARGKEKAYRDRVAELERLVAERAQQQPAQQQEQPKGPPNPEDDIFEYLKYQAQQTDALRNQLNQTTQMTEAQRAQQYVMATYQQDFQQHNRQAPDTMQAYEYLANTRRRELAMMGWDDPAQQTQQLVQEEMNIVQFALQNGRSPTEIIYGLAKERGYVPASTAVPPPSANASNGNGAALDRIAQSQAANMSLGAVPGGAVRAMTPADLASMSESDFWNLKRTNPRAIDKAMGRI